MTHSNSLQSDLHELKLLDPIAVSYGTAAEYFKVVYQTISVAVLAATDNEEILTTTRNSTSLISDNNGKERSEKTLIF